MPRLQPKRRDCGIGNQSVKGMARFLCSALTSIAIVSPAYADAVWHCSRNAQNASQVEEVSSIANPFALASVNDSAEVIGISVRDLIDIYTGTPVSVSGLPMSACFSLGDDGSTVAALSSLGISQGVIQSLSRQSSIVQNNLFYVRDESEMLSCIAKHFPAVGYLMQPTESAQVQPCF